MARESRPSAARRDTATRRAPPPRPKRDPRDSRIASQKGELTRLRQENKRLTDERRRFSSVATPTRRSRALANLTAATQQAAEAVAASRRVDAIVLQPLTPPIRTGLEMAAAINRELREMTIETRRVVRDLARAPHAEEQTSQTVGVMDAPRDLERPPRSQGGSIPQDAQRQLEALQKRYRDRFAALADEWSRKMIVGVVEQSTAQLAHGLKDAATRMEIISTMSEPRMRAIVEASTKSCAQLITRIPEKYLGEVQIAVMSAITTGSGLEELVPYLTKRYEGDARHAHLTALDQVRKASESINAARVQALGSEEFVWIHVGGERYPRPLHVSYSGKTFRYDDLPIIDERTGVRGKPGDAIGCRCRQRAIFRFTRNDNP